MYIMYVYCHIVIVIVIGTPGDYLIPFPISITVLSYNISYPILSEVGISIICSCGPAPRLSRRLPKGYRVFSSSDNNN